MSRSHPKLSVWWLCLHFLSLHQIRSMSHYRSLSDLVIRVPCRGEIWGVDPLTELVDKANRTKWILHPCKTWFVWTENREFSYSSSCCAVVMRGEGFLIPTPTQAVMTELCDLSKRHPPGTRRCRRCPLANNPWLFSHKMSWWVPWAMGRLARHYCAGML